MLEQVLVLGLDEKSGHEILGARDSMAVGLDGSSTSSVPDQLYIDRTGRLTIVELKRVTAGPKELAQLLAYGEHYRPLPWGELEGAFSLTRYAKPLTKRRAEAEEMVRALAEERAPQEPKGTKRAPYAEERLPVLRAAALERWKREPIFAMPAAPPRLILAAPEFAEPVRSAADEMRQRGVDIRLAKCGLLRAPDRLVLRWEWVPLEEPKQRGESAPMHGPTYRWSDILCEAMACFAEEARLRELLVLNGWAENMQKLLVSVSLKEHWPVRLYLDAEEGKNRKEDKLTLWTWLPHSWCEDSDRAAWKKELHDALDEIDGEHADDGIRYWSFDWPGSREDFVDKAAEVARVLSRVLGKPPSGARGGR
jgi:hypothetical protein